MDQIQLLVADVQFRPVFAFPDLLELLSEHDETLRSLIDETWKENFPLYPQDKQTADAIPLGTMRFRQFAPGPDPDQHEAQLMIRHPNYSGMQMDQLTRLYVPAHFVSSIKIWQGDNLLLGIETGISISENPEFRFNYRPNGATTFHAAAEDNEGGSFKQSWSVTRA